MTKERERVDGVTYVRRLNEFVERLREIHREFGFDAIVAPKRSGLFPGALASYALRIPLFTPAEAKRIPPSRFQNVLVVDATVCKGKTLRKIKNQLGGRKVFTAAVWREGEGECDFVLINRRGIVRFFYEE